eukprot:366310-Chlamydomonas_euryale.AAC.4
MAARYVSSGGWVAARAVHTFWILPLLHRLADNWLWWPLWAVPELARANNLGRAPLLDDRTCAIPQRSLSPVVRLDRGIKNAFNRACENPLTALL